MRATIIQHPDQAALFNTAVNLFFSETVSLSETVINVALPGGRSIVGFLQTLRNRANECPRSIWEKLHFFMVDERLVPLDDDQSNYKLVYAQVLGSLVEHELIKADQLHPFILQSSSEDFGVGDYGMLLRKFGGRFDISFVGVGEDAHIGALFPHHHSLKNPSQDFITMPDSPKPPPQRMSASAALISKSKAAFAIFTGEGKREALEKYLNPEVSLEACPAKLIDQVARGYILTDLPLSLRR